ncbi:hypothetical protein JWG45_10800 [Leptospira sp. 201903070]|uniref:TIGR04452 family lipoprotein n=1 Tax=Leptospira ainlahdjerensis TaxID=2810033 RepID=A0ABS2UBA5_9LEPT|nr:hypothetical protein [Leptospira ainlahdjerensis]MBM9577641.1 hypothetical protein [Leptospira ainlahdjerensis]
MKIATTVSGLILILCVLFFFPVISDSSQSVFQFWKHALSLSQSDDFTEDPICDLSVLELGDGGWVRNKPSDPPRPVLMEYILTHCQK